MDEFIDVALGRRSPSAGGAEGREALRIALAILESARSGEVVRIP
jgi:predicted dehydrogenase